MKTLDRITQFTGKLDPTPPVADKPDDEPYAGFLRVTGKGTVTDDEANFGRQNGEIACTAPHLLISGRTGGRKSRATCIPNALLWTGPAIIISAKADLIEHTVRQRAAGGPVYVLDLAKEVHDADLRGVPVTRVSSDPCALVRTDDEALEMAKLLTRIGGSRGGGDGDFWADLAVDSMAALLRAGGRLPHPDDDTQTVWGGGIDWVRRASQNNGLAALEARQAAEREAAEAGKPPPPLDLVTPSWTTAHLRAAMAGSKHAEGLLSAQQLDSRQRDSILINLKTATGSWALDKVTGAGEQFAPTMLTGYPAPTLYIVSPADGVGGPAAATVVTAVVDFWRQHYKDLPPIALIIDECPSTCFLPQLPEWVGVGRGYGIRLIVAVQSTNQFKKKWGADDTQVLRDIFPAILVLPGAPERELLDQAAWASGQRERVVGTPTADRSDTNYSSSALIDSAELTAAWTGEGRLLLSGRAGVAVTLPDYTSLNLG